jgi:hypothetical protein
MADLKALGQVGSLDANLGREKTRPGGGAVPGNTVSATEGTN